MTDDDECPHGLDRRWCGVCLHGPSRPQPVTVEATFAARYEGHCSPCNLPISVGQVVSPINRCTVERSGVTVTISEIDACLEDVVRACLAAIRGLGFNVTEDDDLAVRADDNENGATT